MQLAPEAIHATACCATPDEAYVDSGVLIKLYVREHNSAAAANLVATLPSVKLYPFQELEVRNTLCAHSPDARPSTTRNGRWRSTSSSVT